MFDSAVVVVVVVLGMVDVDWEFGADWKSWQLPEEPDSIESAKP